MRILLTPPAAQDWSYWRQSDPAMAQRVRTLMQRLAEDDPLHRRQVTPLATPISQLLSVKIMAEHRLVFERKGDTIIIHQCRYHY